LKKVEHLTFAADVLVAQLFPLCSREFSCRPTDVAREIREFAVPTAAVDLGVNTQRSGGKVGVCWSAIFLAGYDAEARDAAAEASSPR
jgi:hypothetical protein